MILRKRALGMPHEWKCDQHGNRQDCQQASGVGHPFSNAQATCASNISPPTMISVTTSNTFRLLAIHAKSGPKRSQIIRGD